MGYPVLSGFLAGMFHTVISPEHLSTIITFSAFQGEQAFWLGIRWGIGHMGGMVSVACIFLLLKSGTGFQKYEHSMDYAIGVFLTGFGFYFLCNAHMYFDAEWKPRSKGCSCHNQGATPDERSALVDEEGACNVNTQKIDQDIVYEGCNECNRLPETQQDVTHGSCCAMNNVKWQFGRRNRKLDQDRVGQAARVSGSLPSTYLRQWGTAVTGFVQGLACPASLVGVAFLKSCGVVDMIIFCLLFFVTATLSMGLLAMSYGVLTQQVSCKSLARGIYYGSASLSISLGIVWIYLNASGSLDKFFGHEHLHSTGSTSLASHMQSAGGSQNSEQQNMWRIWVSLLL